MSWIDKLANEEALTLKKEEFGKSGKEEVSRAYNET